MEEIKSKEIDLSALRKLRSQGTKSTIYTDGFICYKFLDGLYEKGNSFYFYSKKVSYLY